MSPTHSALAATLLTLFTVLPPWLGHAEPFELVALGDTAYRGEADYPKYRSLIRLINAEEPAFTIHVGDTWGLEVCNRESHERILGLFNEFTHPLVYTPGDNEWVDCIEPEAVPSVRRAFAGSPTPDDLKRLAPLRTRRGRLERASGAVALASLTTLREVFFSQAKSLGKKPRELTRQSDSSDFEEMVENALFEHEGVLVGTVHVPGSHSDFVITSPENSAAASSRNRANVAWLERIFAEAKQRDAKAVIVAMHASLFQEGPGNDFSRKPIRDGENGPYYWVAWTLRDLAAEYGRPVLLIHGDFHEFVVDRPFLVSQGELTPPKYGNITRLQVYGSPDLRAVRVTVDTATPWVFGFTPLYE